MKKRKLNKKGKLLIIFLSTLLIMPIFQILGTNKKQTTEISVNIPIETNVSKNTVKMQNTAYKDPDRLCELYSITCPEENETELVKKISAKYDVDWKLIEAIVRHETGNRTSRAYHELNNVGGLMGKEGLMKFDSKEESYERLVYIIKNYYIDMGLTTIEQIGSKYCPVGAKNDPNNLNQYWVKGVKSIYENL